MGVGRQPKADGAVGGLWAALVCVMGGGACIRAGDMRGHEAGFPVMRSICGRHRCFDPGCGSGAALLAPPGRQPTVLRCAAYAN